MQKEAAIREPLILGDKSYSQITEDVMAPIVGSPTIWWKVLITISGIIAAWGVGTFSIYWELELEHGA